MKFSVKDLVTFAEEILNRKLYFIFCAVSLSNNKKKKKKIENVVLKIILSKV